MCPATRPAPSDSLDLEMLQIYLKTLLGKLWVFSPRISIFSFSSFSSCFSIVCYVQVVLLGRLGM